MEIVTLAPVVHKGTEQILIRFDNLRALNLVVRKLKGVKWSQTHKSWYLPLTEQHVVIVSSALKDLATIKTDELRTYLVKRKAVRAADVPKLLNPEKTIVAKAAPQVMPKQAQPPGPVAFKLSNANLASLQQTIDLLILKAYSLSTVRTYRAELLIFFQVLGKFPAANLTADDIKRWLLTCFNSGLTENTMHSRINALKFYYEQVLNKEKFFFDIPRPKKHQQLPNVLGEKEITRLFNALTNKKHKAILFTAYSAGLRVSEVVNLQLKDVDSDRMQLFIERAKGKKDRYVNLSPVLLDVLRSYIQGSKPRPKKYLFEGQEPGTTYSARSAQKVFQMARNAAGIKKTVSFHCLRHSFATHILEKGIDIRYIKDILGHFNIKTTERYLHVKRETLINIVSPLDDLWKKGDIEW